MPVFLDTASNSYKACDANDATRNTVCTGITVGKAYAAGCPISVQTGGTLAFGAILTAGTYYFVSTNVGKIKPSADLTTGDAVIQLGYATTTGNMTVKPIVTGVTL